MAQSSAAAPARYTFRKAERLCSRRLLDGLFRHGTAFNTYPLRFVVWRTEAGTRVSAAEGDLVGGSAPDSATIAVGLRTGGAPETAAPTGRPAQLGRSGKPVEPVQVVISVSKRHFKRAHDRNRIKRQLREAWRLQKHLLLHALAPSSAAAGETAARVSQLALPSSQQPHEPPGLPAAEPPAAHLAAPPQSIISPLSQPLLIGVLYIGKEKPESLAYVSRRLRKGLDRLRAELPIAPPASPL